MRDASAAGLLRLPPERLPERALTADLDCRTSERPGQAMLDYFRLPENLSELRVFGTLSSEPGYFSLGGTTCYGRCSGAAPARSASGPMPDVGGAVGVGNGRPFLPFDLTEVVGNLREERYAQGFQNLTEKVTSSSLSRAVYYSVRPILPVGVRKHLQKIRLNGWRDIAFPRWPVDTTVDTLMRRSLALVLRTTGLQRIPFIWFWPDGAHACLIVTHDVEGPSGERFCDALMDLDESAGIESAFQIVPELEYARSGRLAERLRSRGFEVNVHDLNHDGHLFRDREQFLARARQINRHARAFDSRGFRSAGMYREQQWFDELEVSFDMSVPNVAHLEPQRGGCCTVMPYFVGKILELPLTTIQDYSLFHILDDYSLAFWRQQIDVILSNHGLVTILTHPDYLVEKRARAVYADLLAFLGHLRDDRHVWATLPGEVDDWWRSRSRMRLVPDGDSWRIEGPGRKQARVAYASIEGGRVVYGLD